jgi:RNA polymerase sigma-70 factor (ECF subfamily)
VVPVDRDLVEQAQRGDREAFAVLARAHGDSLFAIAQRILRDTDRSEDATQQTLVIAWRELRRLRDPDRFVSWLRQILVRSCYTELARDRRLAANVHVLVMDEVVASPELTIADRDQLDHGFRRLPPEQRAILVLRHYLGLSPGEIAETLGVPLGTVRSRLHYAYRAMRAALDADERAPVATQRILR